jgi:release factor glutamine methyltransferase
MLESVGVSEPEREAREIVAAVLDVPRFWAAANSVADATPDVARSVIRAAMNRAAGAPLAYAVGRASFRHLTLEVDERVLIPRVETEVLVERVLERCTPETRRIADIGTGSGAIGLSLAFERNFDIVIATDISLDAISVAAANASSLAEVLKSAVEFRHGSLLAPLAGETLDAIVCNPPYISFAEIAELPADVRDWEPSVALLCAEDGLSVTRELIRVAPSVLEHRGFLALEVDTRRAGTVAEMIAVDGRYSGVEVLFDLTGRERFVFATRA